MLEDWSFTGWSTAEAVGAVMPHADGALSQHEASFVSMRQPFSCDRDRTGCRHRSPYTTRVILTVKTYIILFIGDLFCNGSCCLVVVRAFC